MKQKDILILGLLAAAAYYFMRQPATATPQIGPSKAPASGGGPDLTSLLNAGKSLTDIFSNLKTSYAGGEDNPPSAPSETTDNQTMYA